MGRPLTSGRSGRRETAATANRAWISSERGERVARGTRRGDEANSRPTHVRSRGTTLRVRVHAATSHTTRVRVIHTRACERVCTLARGHVYAHGRVSTRTCVTTRRSTGRICVCGRKPAVRIDRARSARFDFFLPADARER